MDLNLFSCVLVQEHTENPSHVTDLIVITAALTVKYNSHLGSQGTCFSWHFITVNHINHSLIIAMPLHARDY